MNAIVKYSGHHCTVFFQYLCEFNNKFLRILVGRAMSMSSNTPLLQAEGPVSPFALETVSDLPEVVEEAGLEMATLAEAGENGRPEEIHGEPAPAEGTKEKDGQATRPTLVSQKSNVSQAANVKGLFVLTDTLYFSD